LGSGGVHSRLQRAGTRPAPTTQNTKLQELNPKQIQISKVKTQNDKPKCEFLTFALSFYIFIFTFCIPEEFGI
jgi:hypothetical protein